MMRRIGFFLLGMLLTVAMSSGLSTVTLATSPAHPWANQIIYLVMPDRFYNGNPGNDRLGTSACFDPNHPFRFHGGDWDGLRQKIPYLRDLGVTATWMTPGYKQVGPVSDGESFACGYHGYWPDLTVPDDGATEPKFGGEAALAQLLQAFQTNGIKFILDQIVNHAGYNARITQQKPEWFNPQRPDCETLGDPEIVCPLAKLPDFNFNQAEAVNYITQESVGWLQRLAPDGIRMDTAKHVPLDYFRNIWIPLVKRTSPNLFTVGEILDQESLPKLKPFVDAGFDSVFNFPLQKAMEDTFGKGQSVDQVAGRVAETLSLFGDKSLQLVNLLDNHDVPRFTNAPGLSVSEAEIRQRYHLALGTLLTLPGIPQLYYGDELGMYGGGDPDNRRDMPDWAWTMEGRKTGGSGFLPEPQQTFRHVQKLIAIRKQNPALQTGYYAELWRQNGPQNPDVYAFLRSEGNNRLLVVLNNGTLPSGDVTIPIAANSQIQMRDRTALRSGAVLEDLLDAGAPATVTLASTGMTLNLPAKTMGIYRLRS